jgi:hypothetical protein
MVRVIRAMNESPEKEKLRGDADCGLIDIVKNSKGK